MRIAVAKRRGAIARSLANPCFRQRRVKDKKKYTLKGRTSSTRKFEDFIQLANGRGLIKQEGDTMAKFFLGMLVGAALATYALDAVTVDVFVIRSVASSHDDGYVDYGAYDGGYDYSDLQKSE